MRTEVLLAGGDLDSLLSLVMELGPASINPTIVESRQPVTDLIRRPAEGCEAGIIALRGSENVADLHELFGKHPHTRFVLLAPLLSCRPVRNDPHHVAGELPLRLRRQ